MESSIASKRKWAELTGKEEEDRLRELGRLLKENGLGSVQPVSTEHQFFMLKSGMAQTQSKLMITGKVGSGLSEAVKKFKNEATALLSDINPYTYLIRIDVESPEIGSKFEGVDGLVNLLTGEAASLRQTSDSVLLFGFWASWCKPSIRAIAQLQDLQKKHKDTIRVVGINTDESPEQGLKTMKEEGLDEVEHLHVGQSSLGILFGSSLMPKVVLINKAGHIGFIGLPHKIDLDKAVEVLIANGKLELDPEALTLGELEASTKKEEEKSDAFTEGLSLGQAKDEMERLQSQLTQVAKENEFFKEGLKGLENDTITVLRQSKYDSANARLLTSFKQTSTLAGPEEAVSRVRTQLEAFMGTFGGSFQKEWAVTVIAA